MSNPIIPENTPPIKFTVFWERAEKRPAPRPSNSNRFDTFVPVICGCGAEYWLRRHDARKTVMCSACQRKARALKGHYAQVDKYDRETILNKIANALRQKPSWAEEVMMNILTANGIGYEREVVKNLDGRWYIIDIVLPGERFIEINGWGHQIEARVARDQRLVATGVQVLFVTTDDLRREPLKVRDQILTFIQ